MPTKATKKESLMTTRQELIMASLYLQIKEKRSDLSRRKRDLLVKHVESNPRLMKVYAFIVKKKTENAECEQPK